MITSAGRVACPGDVEIADLAAAGLPVACVVRTEKIATIDARFAERAGRLAEADRPQVVEGIRRIMAPVLLSS
jgi:mRNA interferase MazF